MDWLSFSGRIIMLPYSSFTTPYFFQILKLFWGFPSVLVPIDSKQHNVAAHNVVIDKFTVFVFCSFKVVYFILWGVISVTDRFVSLDLPCPFSQVFFALFRFLFAVFLNTNKIVKELILYLNQFNRTRLSTTSFNSSSHSEYLKVIRSA